MQKPRSRNNSQKKALTVKKEKAQSPKYIKTPKAVLDTCILLSAKIGQSRSANPCVIMERWRLGNYILITSNLILEEAIKKLNDLNFDNNQIKEYIKEIIRNENTLYIKGDWKTNVFDNIDKTDNHLAAACYECNADYLITSENKLLLKKQVHGTKIINTKNFLIELDKLYTPSTEKIIQLDTRKETKFKTKT